MGASGEGCPAIATLSRSAGRCGVDRGLLPLSLPHDDAHGGDEYKDWSDQALAGWQNVGDDEEGDQADVEPSRDGDRSAELPRCPASPPVPGEREYQ